jgi:hypothetical protein
VWQAQSQSPNESTVVGQKKSKKQANKESKKNTDVEEDTDSEKEKKKEKKREKKKEEDDQRQKEKLLKGFPCLKSFLKFSGSARITVREYWKTNMAEKPVPTSDEVTITDVENASKKDDPEPNRNGSAEAKDDNSSTTTPITLALGVDRDTRFISHAKITINEPELNKLMQILLAHYPGYGPDIPNASFTIPFEPIVQSWDSLLAILSESNEQNSALLELE